jgi:hypothetical protein
MRSLTPYVVVVMDGPAISLAQAAMTGTIEMRAASRLSTAVSSRL